MLWFLHLAHDAKFVVERYRDEASGVLAKNAEGRQAMTQVTLRPEVAFAGTPAHARSSSRSCTTARTSAASSPIPSRPKSPSNPASPEEEMSENLIVEKRNTVAIVTLNRPEVRNAFDDAMIAELTKAFRDLGCRRNVRAVVLAGSGPAFCAGADLNWMKRMAGYGYEENLADAQALADDAARRSIACRKPTVARVHGAGLRRRRGPGRRLRHRDRRRTRRSSA